MSKYRDLRRTDWKRITQRQYISCDDADIFGSFGRISLIRIDDMTAPLTVQYRCAGETRDVLIVDKGFFWLQAAVPDAHWWMTAMYDARGRLIQIYFDITDGNRFDDPENPVFEDMYLDIVVASDGSIEVVDRDELDEAFAEGIISDSQYTHAITECEKLRLFIEHNVPRLFAWCDARKARLEKELCHCDTQERHTHG